MRPTLPPEKQETEIKFQNGDACAIDWSDGDVVFANSTCFDATLMERLAHKAKLLRPGAAFPPPRATSLSVDLSVGGRAGDEWS